MNNNLFRLLPKVDKLLGHKDLESLGHEMNYHDFSEVIKEGIGYYRNLISKNMIEEFCENDVIGKILEIGNKKKLNSLQVVINGTGTIIHTNLGRSLFSEKMVANMSEISCNYNNLEYDLEKGSRGSRYTHLEELICTVTGAEGAVVVNNNASAVILALNEFAAGGETIVSRGELVEIGGSFRIPDIMKLAGTKLVEVGTTNRTHEKDYREGISENTKLLLKIHASNYKMLGFTSAVTVEEIASLGREKNIISMEDIGSGVLVDFSKYGVTKEPTVQESIKAGVDIVMFSGDKLLGGPQAGIIVGKKEYIERLKKNQYLRAFRMNKSSIAALEVLFKYYLDEREAIKSIPTLRLILEGEDAVLSRAKALSEMLDAYSVPHKIIPTRAKIGGGSMPEETVPSYAIAFTGNANKLEAMFRGLTPAVVGRIYQDQFVIDMKTVLEKDYSLVATLIKSVISPQVK